METSGLLKKLSYPLVLSSALLLSACGGSSTSFTELDRIPAPDGPHDHGHNHGALTGRLLLSAPDDQHVYVFDLESEALLTDFHLSGVPSQLYASPSYRYGIVVQGGDNGYVNVVDSGIYEEDHGDHGHLMKDDPSLLDYELLGERPAHVTQADESLVIFFDGNAGAPAFVSVFDEHDIRHGHDPNVLEYTSNQHGAAQGRGGYLVSTVRGTEADPDSTLPNQVAVYHLHHDHYDQEELFEALCPGLHGSAQNHDFIAFGCSDGVLLIEEEAHSNHSHFEASKLEFDHRISNLFGHHNVDTFVGVGSGVLYSIDPSGEGAIETIEWTSNEEHSPADYGFAEHGERFVILDNQGGLTLLDTHDWSVHAERVQVTDSTTALEGSAFQLAVSGDGHYAFVSDSAQQTVKVVDLDHGEVIDTFTLDFTPHRLVWLGLVDNHHDSHDHHDDDHHDHHDH